MNSEQQESNRSTMYETVKVGVENISKKVANKQVRVGDALIVGAVVTIVVTTAVVRSGTLRVHFSINSGGL